MTSINGASEKRSEIALHEPRMDGVWRIALQRWINLTQDVMEVKHVGLLVLVSIMVIPSSVQIESINICVGNLFLRNTWTTVEIFSFPFPPSSSPDTIQYSDSLLRQPNEKKGINLKQKKILFHFFPANIWIG